MRRIPRALALRHDVLSLAADGNQLTVALADAADRDVIERIRLATGMHVRAYRAPREAIRARLSVVYPEALRERAEEAPAVRALDGIHDLAVRAGASDIHVEPTRNGGRVRYRVDGMLREMRSLPSELYAQVLSRVKLLAGMDIADRRQPQDGRYAIEVDGRSVDARVSSMPTILGEKIAIRLLDHDTRIPSLDALGMPERLRSRFLRAIHAPHGFILACGSTGSGKTTTLYAAMAERNVDSQSLCSVEDPVEVRIPGIAQLQVNAKAGVTFASALRAFLRQDPDVIMVGEMRDAETASVAASASLSGQLVLTTLHSSSAPGALDRLLELGVSRQTIAAGLSAILSQRLVRRLCRHCAQAERISPELAREFGVPEGAAAYRASGCSACAGTGYSGRIGIFEIVFVNDEIRRAVAEGASSLTIAQLALREGYEPMIAQGIRRVLRGETTLEELRRVLAVQGDR